MKRIIIIALLSIMAFAVQAQTQTVSFINPNGYTLDTVSNAVAKGSYVAMPAVASRFGVTAEVTKISGTVAGKLYLRAANRTSTGAWANVPIDSLVLEDRTLVYRFSQALPTYQFYQVYFVGTGSMSASYRATLYYRKP